MKLIAYDEGKRLFVLDNGRFAYTIYVNDAGYLETVYFGASRAEYGDIDCVRGAWESASPHYDVARGVELGYADKFKSDAAPLEISPHGVWDKRGAPVILRGLDAEKRYHNDFDGQVHTGEYYMRVGLNFSREWLQEFDCRRVLLTEAK